jgi:hypothetical protein
LTVTDAELESRFVMRGDTGIVKGVTNCVGVDVGEERCELLACTVNEYGELFSRPVTVQVVGAETAGGTNVVVQNRVGSSTAVAVYEVTLPLISTREAFHETVACWLAAVAVAFVGVLSGNGAEARDVGESPMAVRARTVKV